MRALLAAARIGLLGLLGLLGAGEAAAHVAASVDDNNRYVKLSLMGDRVRLVYTVFFGEVPGRAMRPGLDRNRDGQLDDAETDAFARRLADEVAGQLAAEVDGAAAPVRFAQVSFGSETRAVGGRAFSIDLVATLCLPAAGAASNGEHRVRLRDRFSLPRPGETEVHLEDGPGISISSAAVGEHRFSGGLVRFAGLVPAFGEPGLSLAFRAAPDAPRARDGVCDRQGGAGGGGGSGGARWWPIGAALIGALALLGIARRGLAKRRGGGDDAERSGSADDAPPG